MAQTAELDVHSNSAPDTIEATLNYIVDDGKPVFTIVAAPGGSDTRSGATPDPHRVTIHNGRQTANDFVLEKNGFVFVRHDTKVRDFYDANRKSRAFTIRRWLNWSLQSGAARRRAPTTRCVALTTAAQVAKEDPRGRKPRATIHTECRAAARARHPRRT